MTPDLDLGSRSGDRTTLRRTLEGVQEGKFSGRVVIEVVIIFPNLDGLGVLCIYWEFGLCYPHKPLPC